MSCPSTWPLLVLGYFSLIVIEVEANSEGRTIRLVEINVIVAGTQQFCGWPDFEIIWHYPPNSYAQQ